MDAPIYLSHRSSLEHDTGNHPERAARIEAIETRLEREDWLGMRRVEAPAADVESILAVHSAAHVERIRTLSERGGGPLDLDTVLSAGSYDAALHAAGGATTLVDQLLQGAAPSGFLGARPPGHHAERDRGMGFCLFNTVAVGARHALGAGGCERVLILDWDVHHGNGTDAIFHDTDAVLFVSIHQSPLYPGTGPADSVGAGDGVGHTINLPVPAGSGDAVFTSHVHHLVGSVARAYRPDLILVSAGYDAHRDDPLASCRVTEDGFATMTTSVRGIANDLGVPIGVVLEGGYDLDALARSVAATLGALVAAPGDGGFAPDIPVHPLTRTAAGPLTAWWSSLTELSRA